MNADAHHTRSSFLLLRDTPIPPQRIHAHIFRNVICTQEVEEDDQYDARIIVSVFEVFSKKSVPCLLEGI